MESTVVLGNTREFSQRVYYKRVCREHSSFESRLYNVYIYIPFIVNTNTRNKKKKKKKDEL